MRQVKIVGSGSYLPSNKIENKDLEKELELEENYIQKMTGIEERYYIKDETIEEMALKAVENIFQKNKRLSKEEIGLIIVATTTPDKYMPGIANYIQKELEIENCNAYDVLAGCDGFVNAFDIASTYIQIGKVRRALIVGVDVLSKYTDKTDKGTAIILSDGAGAILIEGQEENKTNIEYFSKIISQGNKNEILTIYNGEKIYMNGKEIYKYAVTEPVKIINDILNEAGISVNQVKYIIPHQSNERIMKAIANRLKIPKEKMYTSIRNTGNTFCASIPIALDQMSEENLLKEGDKIILLGYGGGLNTGAILLGI